MIDKLLQIQKPLLVFLQSIRTDFLSTFAEAISFFGESGVAIIILIAFYWVIDKKKGFSISIVTLSSPFTMNLFKIIFRIPRPWVKFPDEIKVLRQSTATGYAFPSGHSTLAGALYSSLYHSTKVRIIKIFSIFLLITIPISRLYLCCHWPLDVIFGLLLGLFFSSLLNKLLTLYDDERKLKKATLIISPLALLLSLTLSLMIERGLLEASLWKDLMESGALLSALFIGSYLERRYLSFVLSKSLTKRIAVAIVGTLIGIGLWLSIKSIALYQSLFKVIAYFVLVFWVSYLYPLIGIKLGLFEK